MGQSKSNRTPNTGSSPPSLASKTSDRRWTRGALSTMRQRLAHCPRNALAHEGSCRGERGETGSPRLFKATVASSNFAFSSTVISTVREGKNVDFSARSLDEIGQAAGPGPSSRFPELFSESPFPLGETSPRETCVFGPIAISGAEGHWFESSIARSSNSPKSLRLFEAGSRFDANRCDSIRFPSALSSLPLPSSG